jgi:diguanylate cyclase (GGDEF)-like protein
MPENDPYKRQLVRLKRFSVGATVVLVALFEVFYVAVMKVPVAECLIEWVVATCLSLVLIQFVFTVTYRLHDRVAEQSRRLAAELHRRTESEARIRRLAYSDELTGLPNRTLFNDRLQDALMRARRNGHGMAVMMMDLDHFKEVNDKLGHTVGDRLLQMVGERLTATLRESDTVCRLGGDEFLLLLPELGGQEDVGVAANRLLAAIREPFLLDGKQLRITTSLGIALYPDEGTDRDTLVRNADIAMYQVKGSGRDGFARYGQRPREITGS